MKWGLFKCLNEERKFKNRNLKKINFTFKNSQIKDFVISAIHEYNYDG